MQRLKNLVYDVIAKIAGTGKASIVPATLAIIRTDEIGDYILWRNMLECISNSQAFRNYRITLIGNIAWKDIALHFDKDFVDEFIWLDKNAFKSNMRYRMQFLRMMKRKGFEKIINPIYSRSPRVDDAILKACKGSYTIGMLRNEHNVAEFEKGYDEKLYKEIHPLPLTGLFEFERNKKFTRELLQEECDPAFGFQKETIPSSPVEGKAYVVLFPGSGNPARRWDLENFASVAHFIHEKMKKEIVLAGGPGDRQLCAQLASMLDFPVQDLSGKTSLSQFIAVLSKAEFLVSVDTGSVHLAAAAGCEVYGIYDGSQYGRFGPYPQEILSKPFHAFYPEAFEKERLSEMVFENYQYFSPFKMNDVPASRVIGALQTNHYAE